MIRKLFLVLAFTAMFQATYAQNRIGFHLGYLGTYTRIIEYERIDRRDYLLDSVSLKKTTGFIQAELTTEITLGHGFYWQNGFHYSRKGLDEVKFKDSTGWDWVTTARQHYIGLSEMIGYRWQKPNRKTGFLLASGFQIDFAVGKPNGGALFSGPYYRFFMPFCRFNETDFLWVTEGGITYKLGPGVADIRVRYQHGLSDVLEDAFIIGRTVSIGLTAGYCITF